MPLGCRGWLSLVLVERMHALDEEVRVRLQSAIRSVTSDGRTLGKLQTSVARPAGKGIRRPNLGTWQPLPDERHEWRHLGGEQLDVV